MFLFLPPNHHPLLLLLGDLCVCVCIQGSDKLRLFIKVTKSNRKEIFIQADEVGADPLIGKGNRAVR